MPPADDADPGGRPSHLAGPPSRPMPTVYPGWGGTAPFGLVPPPLSGARTVQVMGVFSVLLLPLCGLGVPLAVATLVLAGRARRDLALAGGRGPGGREVRVGVACARVSLVLGGLAVALWTVAAVVW